MKLVTLMAEQMLLTCNTNTIYTYSIYLHPTFLTQFLFFIYLFNIFILLCQGKAFQLHVISKCHLHHPSSGVPR